MFQNSINLLFLPSPFCRLQKAVDGSQQLPYILSAFLTPLQSLPHGQIKQELLAAEPARASTGTQMFEGVYLIWGVTTFAFPTVTICKYFQC